MDQVDKAKALRINVDSAGFLLSLMTGRAGVLDGAGHVVGNSINPYVPAPRSLCCFFPTERRDHTQAIVLGCVGGIVAVGLGLVLAYRLTVEIYDRREYWRFEKEQQQLNWKQVRRLRVPPLLPPAGFHLHFLVGASALASPPHPQPRHFPPRPCSPHLALCLLCPTLLLMSISPQGPAQVLGQPLSIR